MESYESMDGMAALAGTMLLVMAVAAVVGLLVGALILKFSVRLIEGFSPGYGRSLLVVFLAGLVGFVVYFLLVMVMGVGAGMGGAGTDVASEAAVAGALMASLGAMAVSLLANLFIFAFFINLMIKHPDGRAIGFGRSCLAALLYLVIMVILGIVASIALGVLMAALGVGAASMAG